MALCVELRGDGGVQGTRIPHYRLKGDCFKPSKLAPRMLVGRQRIDLCFEDYEVPTPFQLEFFEGRSRL